MQQVETPDITQHVEYDDCGVRRRYELCGSALHGVVSIYDDLGRLAQKTGYAVGRLDGPTTHYAPPGIPIGQIDSALQTTLDSGTVSQPLIDALAEQKVSVSASVAQITVEESGQEWTVTQFNQSYSLLAEAGHIAVYLGRVVRRALFKKDRILSRETLSHGRAQGEAAVFSDPADPPPLFELPLAAIVLLDGGDTAELMRFFAINHEPLSDSAAIIPEVAQKQWTILDGVHVYTVLAVDDRLTVYAGFLQERALFDVGNLVQKMSYQAGVLAGPLTSLGAVQPALCQLLDDPADSGETFQRGINALNNDQIADLPPFSPEGQVTLSEDAKIVILAPNQEWHITQPGQSYTVKGKENVLAMSNGRVLQAAGYAAGQLNGDVTLYNVGKLAQTVQFKEGVLDGTTTSFAADGQTVVSNTDFKEGVKDGLLQAYDDAGALISQTPYVSDQIEGTMGLYQKAALKTAVQYEAGKQNGWGVTYFDSRQIQTMTSYGAGLQDGYALSYYASGQQSREDYFSQGKQQGLYRAWDELGKLTEMGWYEAGQRSGPRIKFYPAEPDAKQETVKEISNYVEGKLDAQFYTYKDDGSFAEIYYYDMGKPSAEPKETDYLAGKFTFCDGDGGTVEPEATTDTSVWRLLADRWDFAADGQAYLEAATLWMTNPASAASCKNSADAAKWVADFYPAASDQLFPQISQVTTYQWSADANAYVGQGPRLTYEKNNWGSPTTTYLANGVETDEEPPLAKWLGKKIDFNEWINSKMEVHDDGTVKFIL